MIRVVLGDLKTGATWSRIGSRVMVLGGSLLVDGEQVATRPSYHPIRDKWRDAHGRLWDTIDFHPVEVVDAGTIDVAETGS